MFPENLDIARAVKGSEEFDQTLSQRSWTDARHYLVTSFFIRSYSHADPLFRLSVTRGAWRLVIDWNNGQA